MMMRAHSLRLIICPTLPGLISCGSSGGYQVFPGREIGFAPLAYRLHQRGGVETHRIGDRQFRFPAGSPACLSCRVVGHVVGVEADSNYPGRMDGGANCFVEPDILAKWRNSEPRRLTIIADVLARELMAQNQSVRAGAVQETERYRGIARVIDRALPFHQHHIGISAALEHQALCRAGNEVGDHRVNRNAPAFDHDSGLAGGDEAGAEPGSIQVFRELELGRHLADVTIGADGEYDVGLYLLCCTGGNWQVAGWLSEIEDLAPAGPGLGGQQGIVTEERVESAPEIAPGVQRFGQPCPPFLRQSASLGSDPHQHCVGPERQSFFDRADHRNAPSESEYLLNRHAGLAPVEHCDSALGQIPDDRIGGLGGHRTEVAVGDDEKSWRFRGHGVTGWEVMAGWASAGTTPVGFTSLTASP